MSNVPATLTEEEDAQASATSPARKRRHKLVLFGGIGLVVVLLLAAGLWFSGILHRGKSTKIVAAEPPSYVDIPDVVTNLDTGSRRAVFIKLKSKLEVAHVADHKAIDDAMPQIVDSLQTYLRSMRPEELHGGDGTYRLREAMMSRVDAITAPVHVMDILFVEMLIQ